MRIAALAVLMSPALAIADDIDVNVDVDVKVRPTVTVIAPPIVEVAPPIVEVAPPMAIVERPPARASLLGSDHWEFGLVVEIGRFTWGDDAGGQIGLRGEIGRQLGAFRLAAEGSVAHVDENGGGELARGGASVRVRAISFDRPTRRDPFPRESAWFLEAGGGYQQIAWPDSPKAYRWDAMLGTGLEIAGGRENPAAFQLGVRLVVAPSPIMNTHDIGGVVSIGGWYGR